MGTLKTDKIRFRPFWRVFAVATILAVMASVEHLRERFDHNAQGEMYRADGGIDFFYSMELAAFTFIVVWIAIFFAISGFWLLYSLIFGGPSRTEHD